jgi:DNA-3-methyladenine glycosylase II
MIGEITYSTHDDGYVFLVHEIIEQMLSIKAGAKIYSRLLSLCSGNITPETINKLSDDEIRSTGTSGFKVSYIRALTCAVLNEQLDLESLYKLKDEEVIKTLTAIKGIGQWTANMYLIFVLNRADILPIEDVAFLQSYKWLYKTDDVSKASITKKCKKWKPYSSVAARFMYRALDSGLTREEFHLFK